MICRLCLKGAEETIQIFEGIGLSLSISNILAKFFWFEPKCDDPISTVICVDCWTKVHEFNEFYAAVEKAHRLLTERFSFKSEAAEKANNSAVAVDVPAESFDADVLLFQSELDDTNIGATDEDADSIASFSNEQFLHTVLSKQAESEQLAEAPIEAIATADSNDATLVDMFEERRETRATARGKIKLANEVVAPPAATSTAKRRGRPRKGMEQHREANKKRRYADYKQSMLEIDQKITQHMRLTCDICHEGQQTFLLLCKHMVKVHHCKGYAICCNKKFYKRSFLTDHIDRHSNPEKFKCELCGKSFADKQCLRNHELLKHQPDEQKTFKCEDCPKRYTKQYLLEQHRIIHKERTLPCEICDRRFPTMSLLGTHVKMVHSNYGTMCDICALVIRGRAAFKRHQLEHEGVTEPKVQCEICGSWHKNKYSLKKHVGRHNGNSEECTCNICGKVSPNRSAMLSHQRYVHMSDRKHECSVCNKAFKKSITLKEHMTMHTGEVLYKCAHCPKTFNSNANKHSHRKKCHPKEFEEARKARNESRMSAAGAVAAAAAAAAVEYEQKIITITAAAGGYNGEDDDEDEKHKILVTGEEDGIEFTLTLSPQTTTTTTANTTNTTTTTNHQ